MIVLIGKALCCSLGQENREEIHAIECRCDTHDGRVMRAAAYLHVPAMAQTKSGVERLYVLDCGLAHAPDQSRWSPGVNVGKALDVSDNCYLIKHAQGWMMWDTGIDDAVADMPNGLPPPARASTVWTQADHARCAARRAWRETVRHQVRRGVAHARRPCPAMSKCSRRPCCWCRKPNTNGPTPTSRRASSRSIRLTKLSGDHDVFGDGSVMIVSTPGHTPGHQSLMVKLPKAGVVILGGDVVHFKENWDNRRVPGMNTDKEQSSASMQRVADLMAQNKAELWINHDMAQSKTMKRPPAFYE